MKQRAAIPSGRISPRRYHYGRSPTDRLRRFADKKPEWLKNFSVGATLVIEIIVPFLFGATAASTPRRGLLISTANRNWLTGNYCFFNLLTIALCLLLIDDASWAPKRSRRFGGAKSPWPVTAALAALILTLPLNLFAIYNAFAPEIELPRPLQAMHVRLKIFGIANEYGLFRVMRRSPRIIFEERRCIRWQPYEFRWNPGDLHRPPLWNARISRVSTGHVVRGPRLGWNIVAQSLARTLLRGPQAAAAAGIRSRTNRRSSLRERLRYRSRAGGT